MNGVGSSFKVRDIKGLGPVKASVMSSSVVGKDGSVFQGVQGGDRNIVLTLGLEPDFSTETVSELRQQLYSFFMTKSEVLLLFYSAELPTVEIAGYVEACEPSIFSQTPEMQISIICQNPDFTNSVQKVLTGTCSGGASIAIPYPGTKETGVELELVLGADAWGVTLANTAIQYESLVVTYTVTGIAVMPSGATVKLGTVHRQKHADMIVGETPSSLLKFIPVDTDWPRLQPGDNTVEIVAPDGTTYSLSYYEKFGAI